MDALSDGCVFQDAPTLEVAAAPSMSTVKDVQLPGSSILAAMPTNTSLKCRESQTTQCGPAFRRS